MPIALDSIQNYARRKGNRVLCGRPHCGYEIGGIRKGIDRWRPNIDYRPGQRKLAPEEEKEVVEETHYDRLINLLTPSERAEYGRAEIRLKDDFVRQLVAYEWDFCFNDGWIERPDGVWGVSRRSQMRMKRGGHPRFRRPVLHHTTGQVEFAKRQPERLPVAIECPRCELLQLADTDKLDLRPIPPRGREPNTQTASSECKATSTHELHDALPIIQDTIRQLQDLSDRLHEQGVQAMRLDKALRRNGLTLQKINHMAVHSPEELKTRVNRDPELLGLLRDDGVQPFKSENLRDFREKLHELRELVTEQAQR